MITPAQAMDNVRYFLKKKTSNAIEEASGNGQHQIRVYLNSDFELVQELSADLRAQGFKAELDGYRCSNGYALDISWK